VVLGPIDDLEVVPFGSSSTAFGRLESSPVRNQVRASSFAKAPQTSLYRDICLS
jgi:hypothetical protein